MSINKDPLGIDTSAWLHNPDLRACQPHDRAVLMDLMCIAHSCTPYGYLLLKDGSPIPDDQIAATVGISPELWKSSRARLLQRGRLKESELNGALYIPRMVRDGAIRSEARIGGALGGNPALTGGHPDHAASKTVTLAFYKTNLPEHLRTPEVEAAVEEWWEYRSKRKFVLTRQAVLRQINMLRPLSAKEAVEWIECAIDKNWRGFYPPPGSYQPRTTERKATKWTDKMMKV